MDKSGLSVSISLSLFELEELEELEELDVLVSPMEPESSVVAEDASVEDASVSLFELLALLAAPTAAPATAAACPACSLALSAALSATFDAASAASLTFPLLLISDGKDLDPAFICSSFCLSKSFILLVAMTSAIVAICSLTCPHFRSKFLAASPKSSFCFSYHSPAKPRSSSVT